MISDSRYNEKTTILGQVLASTSLICAPLCMALGSPPLTELTFILFGLTAFLTISTLFLGILFIFVGVLQFIGSPLAGLLTA